jgi:hypothetical protein
MLVLLDKICPPPERDFIRKLVQGNYLLICNLLLLLYWLVSLLPFFTITSKDYNKAVGVNSIEFSIVLLKPEYQKWLLVSIFVSVIVVVKKSIKLLF